MGRKILHLADLHLGYDPAPLGETSERHRRVRDSLLSRVTSWVLTDGRGVVGAVLIVGDLFERHRPPDTLVASAIHDLSRLEEAGIRVITVPGNHDELTYPDSVYRRWASQWPGILVTTPAPARVAEFSLGEQRVSVDALAYVQGSSAESPGFPDVRSEETFRIAAAHATLTDEIGDFIAEGERALKLNLGEVISRGYDYVALGHIHATGCEWTREGAAAAYPGLIEGKSFGDPGGAGLLLVDPSSRPPRLERVPFAVHRLVTSDVGLQEIPSKEDLEQHILRFAENSSLLAEITDDGVEPDMFLRLRLHGQPSFELDKELLHARFAKRFLKLEILLEDPAWDLGDWTRWREEPTLRGAFVQKMIEKMQQATSEDDVDRLRRAAAVGLHALREASEDLGHV